MSKPSRLPDATTESELAPQVYLLAHDGDLKGDGTLMAGRNVKLAVVNLDAREDLTKLVSRIKGENVALAAGRDIALKSTWIARRSSTAPAR